MTARSRSRVGSGTLACVPRRLTFIIGCTGSGKGSLGRELARRSGGEIVSINSMKVYRRMDIGTAKPARLSNVAGISTLP